MNKNWKYEKVWIGEKGRLQARIFTGEKSEILDFGYQYIPELYIKTNGPSEYKSYEDENPIKKITFKNLNEMYEFMQTHKKDNLYGNIDRTHKFIRDEFPDHDKCNHDFHEMYLDIETRSKGEYLYKDSTVVKTKTGPKKLKEIRKNPDQEVFDPEKNRWALYTESVYDKSKGGFPNPEKASEEITMIQLYDSKLKKYIILGRKDYSGSNIENIVYQKFEYEKDLLNKFLEILNKLNPTCIKTFNGLLFDFPYITNRMKNLGLNYKKLSPVNTVKEKDAFTQDGMSGKTYLWEGIYLVDLRELFLKYAYANLPSNSLDSVGKYYGFEGKVDHSEFDTFDGQYSGKGYIFPDTPPSEPLELEIYKAQSDYKNNPSPKTWKKVEETVFNKFVAYSYKDVELMVKIEEKAKLFDKAKGIAYLCGVNMDEVSGTLKQWKSFVYNECYKNKIILPLTQKYADDDCVYKAGWTTSIPGKHNWVVSFDYTSLYPSLFQAFNIGTDTMVKPHELEQMPELLEIKEKYFTYFTPSKMSEMETKYGGETNDIIEETEYYQFLMDNKDEIIPILKRYNVCATPNGQFFRKNKESISSVLMRRLFNERVKFKRKAQKLYGELEEIKEELDRRNINL